MQTNTIIYMYCLAFDVKMSRNTTIIYAIYCWKRLFSKVCRLKVKSILPQNLSVQLINIYINLIQYKFRRLCEIAVKMINGTFLGMTLYMETAEREIMMRVQILCGSLASALCFPFCPLLFFRHQPHFVLPMSTF